MAFGGGNDGNTPTFRSRKWCTVGAAETVVQQPDAPSPLHIPAHLQPGAVITVDPGSGDLLVLTQTSQLHAFDFLTGRWGTVNDVGRSGIFSNSFNNVLNSVVGPINTYGVIMYGKGITE